MYENWLKIIIVKWVIIIFLTPSILETLKINNQQLKSHYYNNYGFSLSYYQAEILTPAEANSRFQFVKLYITVFSPFFGPLVLLARAQAMGRFQVSQYKAVI